MRRFIRAATAIAWLTLPSCGATEIGRVDIFAQAIPVQAGSISTDLGYQVEVDRAYLIIAAVDLKACASAWHRRFWDLGRPTVARAHTTSSPTRIGSPTVVPYGAIAFVGGMSPPRGAYCTLGVTVSSADADVANPEEDVVLTGRSFWLEGRFRRAESDAWAALHIETTVAFGVDLPLEPLDVEAGDKHSKVTFASDPSSWFQSIDFSKLTADELARAVLANVRQSLGVLQTTTTS